MWKMCGDGVFSVWAVHWVVLGMVVFMVCLVLTSPPDVVYLLLLVKNQFSQSRLGVWKGTDALLCPWLSFALTMVGFASTFFRCGAPCLMGVIERSCLASGSRTLPGVDYAGVLHILLHCSSLGCVCFPDGWPGCSWFGQDTPGCGCAHPGWNASFVIWCFGYLRALGNWLRLHATPESAC